MAEGERAPGPRDVHDPAGFVARLQELKDWSGLTYRELTARAEAVGDSLPRSTVANMLSRATLPREELLVAFVRACGAGPDETERWLAARKHLAARRTHQPAPVPCACPPGACTCPPYDGDPDEDVRPGEDGRPGRGGGPVEGGGSGGDGRPGGEVRPGEGGQPGGAGRPSADAPSDPAGPASEASAGAPARDASGRGEDREGRRDRAPEADRDHAPEDRRGAHEVPGPETPDREAAVDHRRVDDLAAEDRPASAHPAERRVRDVRGWAGRALVPVVGGVALVVAVTTVAAYLGGGGDEDRRPPAAVPPAAGGVDIRAVHSGLCLNERRGQRSGQVYQVECAGAVVPRYSLVRLPGGAWRIASDHPDFGPGCSGVAAEVADEDGAPLTDQECGKRGTREVFRIEPPDGGPERGHRLRNAATGLCVTVPGASRTPWTAVVLKPCAADGTGQLFAFPHRPADR
ncbi:helix-turn-helix domain-containing protein [Streptomyces sp. SudanB25_2051]|uniref:helix-turn-helix domain-containing protein n=1 Tax=Streptomyces sp. SudanB25_2051 TaxID=3035275 RepID=UPI003F55CE9A